MIKKDSHSFYVLQAIFVTFLWSTSWVLIKIGLKDIPPILFAGMRYFLAFVVLLPFVFFSDASKENFKSLTSSDWKNLLLLGILFYFLTQGLQFIALKYIPAVTASLFLNFSSLITAFLGIMFLKENLSSLQWSGVFIFLIGVLLYFLPITFSGKEWIGIAAISAQVFSNSFSSVLGRKINVSKKINPLIVTIISMGVGSLLLSITGISLDGFPVINLQSWGIIIWLAVVNTALAFTIWNNTLRKLTAVESSILNNTMLIQIAFLAFIFLGEIKTMKEIFGLAIAASGVFLVNYKRK